MKFRKYCIEDKFFYLMSYIIAIFVFVAVLYPFIYVVAASFSSGNAISSGKVVLLPVEFTLQGYEIVFNNSAVLTGFLNSVLYTVSGTAINLVMTITAGYCLSRDDVPGAKVILFLFTFTMFFGGNMITNYMLVRSLGFLDTIWAVIIPGAISAYNLIIARTFMQTSIPKELFEAAVADGCSDIKYYLSIVLPLSKPVMSVLLLFSAVGHWNSYFGPMIYLNNRKRFSLPLILKEILISSQIDPSTVTDPELQMKIASMAMSIQYALIVVVIVPIIIIYPFIQKHFANGIMLGAVKG